MMLRLNACSTACWLHGLLHGLRWTRAHRIVLPLSWYGFTSSFQGPEVLRAFFLAIVAPPGQEVPMLHFPVVVTGKPRGIGHDCMELVVPDSTLAGTAPSGNDNGGRCIVQPIQPGARHGAGEARAAGAPWPAQQRPHDPGHERRQLGQQQGWRVAPALSTGASHPQLQAAPGAVRSGLVQTG